MTAGAYGPLLDAVRGVRWPAARRVGGATLGAHPATLRGNSSEFSEFRPYRQGDDPRRVDWRLLARSDRAYVRLTTDRAVHRTVLLCDASASMAFPLPSLDKWRLARELCVALASVAHAAGDPVGLSLASQAPVALAPRARRSVLAEMIGALDGIAPTGATALAPLLASARGARLVLITDLLGDTDEIIAAARLRVAAGDEVIVVHVLSPLELVPPGDAVVAVDPEHPAVRRTLDGATRAAYDRALAAWLGDVRDRVRLAGAAYHRAATDEPTPRIVRRIALGAGSSPK